MKKLYLPVLAVALVFNANATRAFGRSAPSAKSEASAPMHSGAPEQSAAPAAMQSDDKTPPSYDMKGQALVDLEQVHQKFVALAEAVPADKYIWRPGEGVRSIGEVFLHIAAANHNIPTMMGVAANPKYMAKDFQSSITDKKQIVDELSDSFLFAIAEIKKMSNADFAKPEKALGPDANAGDVIYILVTHAHEHLGQSIAYARINGIVPPWTAAAEAAAAKKKAAAAPDKD
jgi:uncharacterized damage-inducible protein DinB